MNENDLYIMASIANAGTESRRVFHSMEIESLIAEMEQDAARERERREARLEGEKAVHIAQERRRVHLLERKAKRHDSLIAAVAAVLFTLAMFLIPSLASVL
jgi:hypothetical protein